MHFSRGRDAAAIGASALLVARRARSDLAALIGIVVLIAITSAISVAMPREIDATLDCAAREAVAAAGADADLLLQTTINDPSGQATTTAERIHTFGGEMPGRLPATLSDAAAQVSTAVLGPELDGVGPEGKLRLRIGVLDPAAEPDVRLVQGEFSDSAASDAEGQAMASLDVAVSAAAAEATGLAVGDTVDLAGGADDDGVTVRIVGVIDPVDASDPQWIDLPGLWDPGALSSRGTRAGTAFTALTDPAAFDRVSETFAEASEGIVRISFDPSTFDMRRFEEVRDAIDEIETTSSPITEGAPFDVSATSGYEEALIGLPAAAGAATAQLSTLAAGLLGVAVLVTVLATTALARRRQPEVALLRSRGASLGLIGVHAALESVLVALLGIVLGVAATVVFGGPIGSPLLLIVAATIITAAPVVSTLASANGSATSSVPSALRIAGAAALVAATVTAVAALHSGARAVGAGVDPLALAAPVLTAAVVAIGLSPLPAAMMRPLSRLAVRARGPGMLLAASSARDGRSIVTLIALILASSVAVTSLVLLQTVAAGQEAASWRAVGADVRIDGAADAADAVDAFKNSGATVTAITELEGVDVDDGSRPVSATLLAVDGDYAGLLSALPDDHAQRPDAEAVRQLIGQESPAAGTEPVPVLLDTRLAENIDSETITVDIDGIAVPVTVIGSPIAGPEAVRSPLVIVDRSRLLAYLDAVEAPGGEPSDVIVPLTTVLAIGPGAADMVSDGDEGSVMIRQDVLDRQRDGALVSGVVTATTQCLVGTALLAVLALVITTVLGARRRGRTLALLEALGVPKRAGLALTAGELVPLVVSGTVGGAIAAAVAIVATAPAFGADILAGGRAPVMAPPWLAVAIIAVATAALTIAVVIDMPFSRRVSTAEILRTGEES